MYLDTLAYAAAYRMDCPYSSCIEAKPKYGMYELDANYIYTP